MPIDKHFVLLSCVLSLPAWAQGNPSPVAPLNLHLRCDRVESTQSSKQVKSASLGFGNPTSPETTEGTRAVDRTVMVEISGATGRIHLPQSLLTPTHLMAKAAGLHLPTLL